MLIAHGNPLFRRGLERVVGDSTGTPVTHVVSAAGETIGNETHMDVAIVGVGGQSTGLIELVERLRRTRPSVGVVSTTLGEDDALASRALCSGPHRHVTASVQPADLLAELALAARHEVSMAGPVARRVVDVFDDLPPLVPPLVNPELTSSERMLLQQMSAGLLLSDVAGHRGSDALAVQRELNGVAANLRTVADTRWVSDRLRRWPTVG